MELTKVNSSPIAEVESANDEISSDGFIVSNTIKITPEKLRTRSIIPSFAKDLESTISHTEFIEAVGSITQQVFSGVRFLKPCVRVSHPIKGRVPEAMGKPVNRLREDEKTVYFERMAFLLDLPEIKEEVNGNTLSLSIGGVRAYNQENLYARKVEERFKVFVGFKNQVCTNLCVSTDGVSLDIRARSVSELMENVYNLLTSYNAEKQIALLRSLSGYAIAESQFAKMIGRARMYQFLPGKTKKEIPELHLSDTQITTVARDYYKDESFCRNGDGGIDLWRLYNLFTGAVKSSYIDTYLDRNVGSTEFITMMAESLRNKSDFWYLS